jgi:hypothetical protein
VQVESLPAGLSFGLSFRTSVLCAVRNLGEPRDVSQSALSERSAPKGSLRHNNRAFGSLPYQTTPLPNLSAAPGMLRIVLIRNIRSKQNFRATKIRIRSS